MLALSKGRDWFLKEVIEHLKYSTNGKIDDFSIEGPNKLIEWVGQPPRYWPKADIWIESKEKIVMVEVDNDSDPGRSLVKYWPIIDEHFKTPDAKEIIFIEVWKGGTTIGRGYAELFSFMRSQFKKIYPKLEIHFIDRKKDTSEQIEKHLISLL